MNARRIYLIGFVLCLVSAGALLLSGCEGSLCGKMIPCGAACPCR